MNRETEELRTFIIVIGVAFAGLALVILSVGVAIGLAFGL